MIFEYDRYRGPAGVPARKTPGQLAYEADCRARPYYNLARAVLRPDWHELPGYARDSWERNPTRRT